MRLTDYYYRSGSRMTLPLAFKAMRGADGLLPLETTFVTTRRARLVGLTAESRLPAINPRSSSWWPT